MRACRWLAVGLVVAVLAVGCSGKPSSGALQVKVNLLPGLKSTCVRVEVYPSGGVTPEESGPILIAGKTQLTVGVVPTGQAEPVTVQAVGYSDADCNSRTTPAEVSDTVSGRFATPVTVLEITLGPPSGDGGTDAGTGGGLDGGSDAGVDGDGDGFLVPEDCDDTDPLVKPGAQELCRDRLDNDCDQLIDCADSSCDLQVCAVTMNGGATCGSGLCLEIACGDQEDNDGDGLPDCRDLADCTGQTCGVSGTCDAADGGRCVALNEMSLCNDGEDNDTDTFVDCADSDCPVGSVCSDFDPCTDLDTCNGSGACVPAGSVTCMSPPNTACYEMMGTCLPDAGGSCDYKLNLGMSCTDGRACTKGDSCDADGGCAGSPTCDTPPGACYGALGTCNEADGGGCDYTPLPAGPCNDGNNCTTSDSCDGDGGCAGSPVTCTPMDQCQQQAGCTDAGTCIFSVNTGAACDAGPGPIGSCNAVGACVPMPTTIFPYTPSNFTEAQLPATAGALTFDCGTTTLDTRTTDGGIGWTTPCGAGSAAFALVTVGAQTAVLLFADSLAVASGSTLRAVGPRPLILAVRNGATVNGTIDVGSTDVGGAGSDQDCGTTGVGSAGGTATPGSNLTAGGGGGGAFGTDGSSGGAGNGSAAGGNPGQAFGSARLEPLHGGCRGGHGGRQMGLNGVRGRGGGAVQLTVGGTLQIAATGRITAYGAGGTGGSSTNGSGSGGGGGGSGGGILLEAATLNLVMNGAITANGGAGGEGGGVDSTGSDGPGGSPDTNAVATTPDSSSCGGTGGSGGAGTTAPTIGGGEVCSSSNSGQGGGGGGGVGRIFLRGSTACTLSGVISPPARGSGANGCPLVP